MLAQLLANGNYQFMSGGFATALASASLEYQPDGTPAYGITWAATAYRSFRMNDLYTAPQ